MTSLYMLVYVNAISLRVASAQSDLAHHAPKLVLESSVQKVGAYHVLYYSSYNVKFHNWHFSRQPPIPARHQDVVAVMWYEMYIASKHMYIYGK